MYDCTVTTNVFYKIQLLLFYYYYWSILQRYNTVKRNSGRTYVFQSWPVVSRGVSSVSGLFLSLYPTGYTPYVAAKKVNDTPGIEFWRYSACTHDTRADLSSFLLGEAISWKLRPFANTNGRARLILRDWSKRRDREFSCRIEKVQKRTDLFRHSVMLRHTTWTILIIKEKESDYNQ